MLALARSRSMTFSLYRSVDRHRDEEKCQVGERAQVEPPRRGAGGTKKQRDRQPREGGSEGERRGQVDVPEKAGENRPDADRSQEQAVEEDLLAGHALA